MERLIKNTLLATVLCSTVTLVGCGSSSSGGGSSTLVDGDVIQGPVSGATVFADLDGDSVLDAGEASTTTASDGSFDDLVIPDGYGDYVLVSLGGTDTTTDEPALPMRAPAGAERITPITTLVASVPAGDARDALIADLDELAGDGNSYDSDPSTGAAADFVSLVKSVEQVLYAMEEIGVTDVADKLVIFEEITSEITDSASSISEIVDGGTLADVIAAGTIDSLAEIATTNVEVTAGANQDALEAILVAVVENVEDAVTDAAGGGDTVNEAEVVDKIDDLDTVIDDNEELDDLETIVTTVVVSGDVVILDGQGTPTLVAANAVSVRATVEGFNNFSEAKAFTGGTLVLSVTDRDSDRSVTLTLTGVSMDVAVNVGVGDAAEAAVTVDLASATLTVAATDSAGDSITTTAVDGPYSIITDNYTLNVLTVNIDEMQELLSDEVSDEFETVIAAGTYDIVLSGTGLPIVTESQSITVE